MDIGLYLDGLNKNVGIDTTRCRELLEQIIVRKVRGIFVPKDIAGMKFIPIYDVWNEEENTYDTEYGEEYTYNVVNCITCGYASFIYSRYITQITIYTKNRE